MSRQSSLPFDARVAVPIGVFYVMLFLLRGVASPFFPLWLQDFGYSSAELAIVLAIPALAGLFTGPTIAVLCNRLRSRGAGLAVISLAAAISFLLLICAVDDAWNRVILAIIWVSASLFAQVQLPLIDVVAVGAANATAPHYGSYRGLGTAAYLAACLTGGVFISEAVPKLLPTWCLLASLGGFVAAVFLPHRDWNSTSAARDRALVPSALLFLRSPRFLALLLVAGLIEASHAYFYSFSSMLWRDQGVSTFSIGAVRAICALAEVAFLFACEPWCRRVGPWNLLMIAGAASVVRWLAMGLGLPLWLEFAVQALHALSYTATFIAALRLVEQIHGGTMFGVGQTLCAAFICSFLPGVTTVFCGGLYNNFAESGYFVMAALAALGLIASVVFKSHLSIVVPPTQRRALPRIALQASRESGNL